MERKTEGKRKKSAGTGRRHIAYQNKDIMSKVLAEHFKGKTFSVYGLDLPKIRETEPVNVPAVRVNELRLDNLFRLEDDTVAIVDYESKYEEKDKIKYLNYLTGIANRYLREKKTCPRLRMIVIYTGDVERSRVREEYDIGAAKISIEPAFLSELDGEGIFRRLEEKTGRNCELTDEELMEFIILPLSFRKREEKERMIRKTAELAEKIQDREQQAFVLAGILAFTDKIIDGKTAERIRRVLDMTKVERMIREEIWADFTKELEEGRQELEKVSREKEKERREKEKERREKEKERREKEKERRGREKEKRKREKERREYESRLKKERQRREEEKQQMIKEIVCRMIKNGESTADIIAAIPEYTYEETEAMRKKLKEECGIVF